MDYTIQIDGNLIETTYGLSITKRLDQELDTAAFILPITDQATPLPMYAEVEINDGQTISYWLIADDVVEPISFSPARYTHTINLVEYTKKLEYYFLTAATFTQPTDGSVRYTMFDVVDRLRKIVLTELQNTPKVYPYVVPQNVELFLDNFKAPEMFFNNLTLFEALQQALMYIGVVPRLTVINNTDTLVLDFIAEEKDLVNLEELWIGKTFSQDALFYSTTLVTEGDNIIATDLKTNTLYYPGENHWAPLNAETGAGIFDNNNAVMNLRQGIYDLIELKVFARVQYQDQNNSQQTADVEVDLSTYVYVKEAYNLLPANWNYISDNKTQQNTIWFEQNDNVIQGLTTDWSSLYTPRRRSLENAILTEFRKTGVLAASLTINNDYFDCLFRAKFIPIQQDRHLEIDRSNVDEIKKITKTFFTQNDRLISLENYTSRLKKTIDRLGEPIITVSLIHPSINEAWEVGDYTTSDYRLVAAEFQFEQDHIIANYQFSKHFPNINRFIGIDRALQPFDIPTGFKVLNRSLLYKDYLTISLQSNNTNNSIVTADGVEQILNTFDNSEPALPSETALIISTFEPGNDEQKGRIQAPAVFNGVENTFIFSFGFDNNVVAGYRLLPLDNDPILLPVAQGYVQAAIPYTEFGGVLSTSAFEIKAQRINSLPTNFNEAKSEANILPLVTWFNDETTYIGITSANPLEVFKDPAEILTFNYQLNVFADTDQIIVGQNFTRLNKLIYDLDEPLYIHYSSETYNQYENTSVKGGALPELLNTTTVTTLPYRLNILNSISANANSYAIGTLSGDLLLAVNRVNGALPTILYFNFSHVRPGTTIL
jgi:hypothetical protein